MNLWHLPKPTPFGDYWLAGQHAAPAILRLGFLIDDRPPKYMASTPIGGVIFTGSRIAAFASPEEALREIRKRIADETRNAKES